MLKVSRGFFAAKVATNKQASQTSSSFKTAAASLNMLELLKTFDRSLVDGESASQPSRSVPVKQIVKAGEGSKKLDLLTDLVDPAELNTRSKCETFLRKCAEFAQANPSATNNAWLKANAKLATLQCLSLGSSLQTLYWNVGQQHINTLVLLNGDTNSWDTADLQINCDECNDVNELLEHLNNWPLVEPRKLEVVTQDKGLSITPQHPHAALRLLMRLPRSLPPQRLLLQRTATGPVPDLNVLAPVSEAIALTTESSPASSVFAQSPLVNIAPELSRVSINGHTRFGFLNHFSLAKTLNGLKGSLPRHDVLKVELLGAEAVDTMLRTRLCLAGLNHEGRKVGLDARSKVRYQAHMARSIIGMVRYLFASKRARVVDCNVEALHVCRPVVLQSLQEGRYATLGLQAKALVSALPSHLLSPSAFNVWIDSVGPLVLSQNDGGRADLPIHSFQELIALCNSNAANQTLVLSNAQCESLKLEAKLDLRGFNEFHSTDLQQLSAIPTFAAHYKDEAVVYEARQLQPGLCLAELAPSFLRPANLGAEKSLKVLQTLYPDENHQAPVADDLLPTSENRVVDVSELIEEDRLAVLPQGASAGGEGGPSTMQMFLRDAAGPALEPQPPESPPHPPRG